MVIKENQIVEQRAYERFKVYSNAYVTFGSNPSMQCKIIDISEGGISFRYEPGEKPEGKELISILINGGEVLLKDIWFIPFYDCEIKNPNIFSFIKERKCGGKFVDLTSDQNAKLEFFIKNYTSIT